MSTLAKQETRFKMYPCCRDQNSDVNEISNNAYVITTNRIRV